MNWSFGNIHRSMIMNNLEYTGYYRYRDVFQIRRNDVPLKPYDMGIQSLEPIVIEYDSSHYREFKVIRDERKDIIESFRYKDFLKELLALLCLITNSRFTELPHQYSIESNHNLGTYCREPGFIDMGEEEMKRNSEFIYWPVNLVGQELVAHDEIDVFFDNFFNLSGKSLRKFRMSLFMYYNSIHMYPLSPSMTYLSLVSCIENLAIFESKLSGEKIERCSECGREKHLSTSKFSRFALEYLDDNIEITEKGLKEIYNKRSRITHDGSLFYHDYAETEVDNIGNHEIANLRMYARVILINWMLRRADDNNYV